MLPNKIQHGDSIARLFDLWNQLIDYLREIRLVAGNGIRISRMTAGTTIESTATATGGGVSAPADNSHPFDVELINNGTEENPDYSARIFNSALPDSTTAGVVEIGNNNRSVPVTEVQVNTDGDFYIDIVITYSSGSYSITFQVRPWNSVPHDDVTTYRKTIAQGKLPKVESWQKTDIEVTGRWI